MTKVYKVINDRNKKLSLAVGEFDVILHKNPGCSITYLGEAEVYQCDLSADSLDIKEICRLFFITEDELLSNSRVGEIVSARRAAAFLLREKYKMT